MTERTGAYPVNLNVDYSETSDRLTVFFRLLMVIPIFIIWSLLSGGQHDSATAEGRDAMYYGVGMIFFPTVLMILFYFLQVLILGIRYMISRATGGLKN